MATAPRSGTKARAVIALTEARAAPIPAGRLSAEMLRHGSLEARFYAPRGVDRQTPHSRDEVYVVVSGHGKFTLEKASMAFGPGDLLFAPAGAAHCFEAFSDDLEVWVVFYGPEGGEAAGMMDDPQSG